MLRPSPNLVIFPSIFKTTPSFVPRRHRQAKSGHSTTTQIDRERET
jgi:hypothetical protein